MAPGAAPGQAATLTSGPQCKGCEVSGIAMTPDQKTMFINIQHSGEGAGEVTNPDDPQYPIKVSSWPGNQGCGFDAQAPQPKRRPRSASVAITREDGGVIGAQGSSASAAAATDVVQCRLTCYGAAPLRPPGPDRPASARRSPVPESGLRSRSPCRNARYPRRSCWTNWMRRKSRCSARTH